jgi:hypothetical protein
MKAADQQQSRAKKKFTQQYFFLVYIIIKQDMKACCERKRGLVAQILQGIIIKEKKKNIPLYQFKLDIAFSPMYVEANMLKQDALTTRRPRSN